jgi:hypothetical protein
VCEGARRERERERYKEGYLEMKELKKLAFKIGTHEKMAEFNVNVVHWQKCRAE